MKLTQYQVDFILDTFFTGSERFAGWRNIAYKLLAEGKCTVAGEFQYKYEIINVIESKTDAKYIYDLEVSLKRLHKLYKYLPKVSFRGMYECFSSIKPEILA